MWSQRDGYLDGITFPLIFEVFKPRERLKKSDKYKTKPQIAGEMIEELQAIGFDFELILADSLYGESDVNFVSILHKFNLNYLLAIRSNHAVWLPKEQKVRTNKWRKFQRNFTNSRTEIRYKARNYFWQTPPTTILANYDGS